MVISTLDLSLLPETHTLRQISQSLAVLDAILSPEWPYRYYSFDAHWSAGQAMASMRNGEGDDYFCVFSPEGAVLKGFDHESKMSPYRVKPPRLWPGILETLPAELREILSDAAFSLEDTTFCIWRTPGGTSWQRGEIQFSDDDKRDGSAEMLLILDGQPQTYQQWAEEYYQQPVDLAAVRHVYAHQPLTEDLVAHLNPDVLLQDLSADLAEIGYAQTC
jgi:hypothetical protein